MNHPHIAAIYGLEESGGVGAIVMEFVEGPTLAERLERGRIPIPEALAIASRSPRRWNMLTRRESSIGI